MAESVPSKDSESKSRPGEKPVLETAGKGTGKRAPSADVEEQLGDLQNRMLGDFLLLRRLGRGGMAEVYLAEQTSLKRNVAVKILRKELVSDESYLKRFKTEAMAAAGLSHPNIVQVYVVGEDAGIQYIAQEYVQGMNLRELLIRKGPPDITVATHIMRQVASALQAASGAGIVHRDIKPENIMITRKGEVKVADFGLAQLTKEGERLNLTQVGVTMGTPLYMSPEQVNGSKLDQRSDIYSFGVTCYHMLSGSPPFRGDTALSVAIQHLKKVPEPLEKSRPDLPPSLCRIVHKMMAKELEDRYQNAQAVLKDLKKVSQERASAEAEAASHAPAESATSRGLRNAAGILQKLNWMNSRVSKLWNATEGAPRKQVQNFVMTAILVAAAGAGIGWLTRSPNPLRAPAWPKSAESTVKTMPTAAEQYFHALQLVDSEAAWKAVIINFPEATLEKQRAQEQLALLYLRKRRLDEALAIFDQFAGFSDRDPEWKAFGLAGQAIIYSLKEEYRQSQQVLTVLRPLYKRLDTKMQELIGETLERNQRKIYSQIGKEDKEFLDLIKKNDQHDSAEQTHRE